MHFQDDKISATPLPDNAFGYVPTPALVGPIDLIAESFGVPSEVATSYRQASERFRTVLAELVCELPLLPTPIGEFYSGSAAPNFVRPE